MMRTRFHSRHIPSELLNFDTPMGQEVRRNGLCDTLEPRMLDRLKEHGVQVIETRLVWWEIEREQGVFDFSRFDRDLARIEQAGLQPGVFPWFQHPPDWYNRTAAHHVRYRCLEHDHDSTIISMWDPATLEIYDRLYGELARRYGDRIRFVYAGISGDFGEVCYPSGVKHYLFSPPHNHEGFWCGDGLARADFRLWLQQRYGDLKQLNESWSSSFGGWTEDLMPELPIGGLPLVRRRDFAEWYVGSLMSFSDAAAGLIRRHFPDTEMAIPLGFPFEKLWVGQIKSQAAKIAARHHMIARWTGMAYLRSFDRSNILARRFASAAHFYGAQFATEAALTLNEENAANGLYEALANGAVLVHDDPQNILRAQDVHQRLRPSLLVSPPTTRVSVLYPLADELLEIEGFELDSFIAKAAAVRRSGDYQICDEFMIVDGYLDQIDDLLVLVSTVVHTETVPWLKQFLHRGGRLWLVGEATLRLMDDNAQCVAGPWRELNCSGDHRHAAGGVYRVAPSAVAAICGNQGSVAADVFVTQHRDFVSEYHAREGKIEVRPITPLGVQEGRS